MQRLSVPFSICLMVLATFGCGRSQLKFFDDPTVSESDCGNRIDDDGDGLVDCLDPDCKADPACVVAAENCGNRIDDDGDGLIDCADPDCTNHRLCLPMGPEICDNGLDDDGDGLADCRDGDCRRAPACNRREVCDNGVDDNGNGLVDCADPDCVGQPGCERPEVCDNGLDDDGDGLVDCFDLDCRGNPICARREVCDNGVDDDGDGMIDCMDSDCQGHPSCGPLREICGNGRDDDLDGRIDCADDDCRFDPRCFGPEVCDNGLDDDGDGSIDCADEDCAGDPRCLGREICGNGRDDDGDGKVDCFDEDCFFEPICGRIEDCGNGRDDDGDGLVDCQDADCRQDPRCARREVCDNGLDDDGDGLVDCDDLDCFRDLRCQVVRPEDCTNGRDDDGDNLIDCVDPDCLGHPACGPTKEICDNLADDDGDGKIDCDDTDCRSDPRCAAKSEDCTNRRDDDGDFLVDCDDPDCFKHPACKAPGKEICNNGIDDDSDGAVDCKDTDCRDLPICVVGKEDCTNQRDDDGDGAVDCDDPDCSADPVCQSALCRPDVDFGTIPVRGAKVSRTVVTKGRADVYDARCSVPGGGEVVTRFKIDSQTDLKVSYEQRSGDHMFSLFRAGIAEACNANQDRCLDPKSAKTGSFTLSGLAPGEYYLFVEAFAGGLEGEVALTLSTQAAGSVENCRNGIDDDQDGAVDCADLDCVLTPECETLNCGYDINVGSLVVNGRAVELQIDTRGAGNDIEERCAGGGGGDVVIRFVMPSAAGLAMTIRQSGWHVFGLHSDMGPGTRCTAAAGSCFDSNATPALSLEYGVAEKGVYYLVVDALDAKNEGQVSLTLRAFETRGVELCANGVDDDGDGLADCLDPDCTGVVGCPGPVCAPEHKTGPLAPGGAPVSVAIDTRSANNDQTVPCALGGGKDQVVEIELTEVSGLRIGCDNRGDHVIGLFAAGAPRDPCDKLPINCADIGTGGFGCNFIFPNLQPGKYYVVVEAFQPGKEGTMALQLSAVDDHAQEICNNGKDDDGDGKIDCQDSNCSTKPLCQGQTCTPEQRLGLAVKGGPQLSVALTTSGAGDRNSASCALGGGEDAVASFTLAESADLALEFAQLGNHVFAIYEDKGVGYACDAAPIACQSGTSQATGKLLFPSLPPGQYFLVVEAISGGAEGSVVMRLAAQ